MATKQAIIIKKHKEEMDMAKMSIVKLEKERDDGKITEEQFLLERLKHLDVFGTRSMYNDDGSHKVNKK